MRRWGLGAIIGVGLVVGLIAAVPIPAAADKPLAVKARIIKHSKNSYEIHVTVQHVDTSWEHYADRWEVIGPGGRVLATRVLFHPHIGERQFTRSLRGVTIPDGVKHIIIRVHDKVHGYGRERLIAMPTDDKPDTGYK
jgi:hypothetical protein